MRIENASTGCRPPPPRACRAHASGLPRRAEAEAYWLARRMTSPRRGWLAAAARPNHAAHREGRLRACARSGCG
jgi:hypothetical protein